MVVRVLTPTQKKQYKKTNTKKATTTVHCYAAMKNTQQQQQKGGKKRNTFTKIFGKLSKSCGGGGIALSRRPPFLRGRFAIHRRNFSVFFCQKIL